MVNYLDCWRKHFRAKYFASVYTCVHVCIYKTLDINLPGVLPVDNDCASINEGEHSFNVSIEKNSVIIQF